MAWIILFFAGLSEVGWAVGLKYTEGFTRLVPSALTIACMVLSLVLLGPALKRRRSGLPTRSGPASARSARALLGIDAVGESASVLRRACIGLIVAGIVGLEAGVGGVIVATGLSEANPDRPPDSLRSPGYKRPSSARMKMVRAARLSSAPDCRRRSGLWAPSSRWCRPCPHRPSPGQRVRYSGLLAQLQHESRKAWKLGRSPI